MTGFIKFEVCISFYISIFQFNLMRRIAMRCLGQNICFNNFQINFGCNFDTSKDVSALYIIQQLLYQQIILLILEVEEKNK